MAGGGNDCLGELRSWLSGRTPLSRANWPRHAPLLQTIAWSQRRGEAPTSRMIDRVLITGGAGFLGLHLANRLRADGLSVRLLDLTEPAEPLHADVEYVRGDVRDPVMLAAVMDDMDAVVHAAFASSRQPAERLHSV